MLAYSGTAYQLHNSFRHNLSNAGSVGDILQVFAKLLPKLGARAAAMLVQSGGGHHPSLRLAAHVGLPRLWIDYLAHCRTNTEPLCRTLRLRPHPIALSDIRRHGGLRRRSDGLVRLLGANGMSDVFGVPILARRAPFSTVLIAGDALALGATQRYLMTQAAADFAARLAAVTPALVRHEPPHHRLTPRQLEIASWLIAGKTDWEIGEILQISPKTVNFHVENIKRTYGVRRRNQFVAAIVHDGGLPPA